MKRRIIEKLLFTVSYLCLSGLLLPASALNVRTAAVYLLLVLVVLAAAMICLHKTEIKKAGKIQYDILALCLLAQDFCLRWQVSSKVSALAEMLKIRKEAFLLLAAAGMGLLSVYSLNTLRGMFTSFWNKNCEPRRYGKHVGMLLSLFFLIFLEFLMLQFGVVDSLSQILYLPPVSVLANCFLLLSVNIILVLAFRKWHISLLISAILSATWGIADYYTVLFHGSPLYLSEFANATTAAHVALQYHYRLSGPVISILLLLTISVVFLFEHRGRFESPRDTRKRLVLRASALGLCLAASAMSVNYSVSRIRPWMPWNVAVEEGGFLVCTLQDSAQRVNPVHKPEGYDTSQFPRAREVPPSETGEYPDIILILNETFCDLRVYSELKSDRDFLTDFYHIDGAVYGHAAAPNVGGGTNNSEFELLTAKSMYLLKAMAPFTYLDQEILRRSTVEYLHALGYSAVGMHCERAENYSRDRGYPAVGFQTVLLGPDSFHHVEANGNRKWLDAGNFADLEESYGEMGESPRFVYLLTFQNHGGYEQNDASLDTIHVQNNFGNLTDDLDEYLSSLELSAKAFRELTEYYAKSERKVIICMVGDHAPSFITSLPARHEMSFEESEIAKRLVPYVIWTNYGAEVPASTDYASMVDLMPMVMETAGLPLPPFYRYILDLHDAYPIRTANGLYMDAEGRYGSVSDDPEAADQMALYYNMEYNSLLTDGSYCSELFELK